MLKLMNFDLQPILLFIHIGLTFYPTGLEISCQELATGATTASQSVVL
jgi:hypothetical protein